MSKKFEALIKPTMLEDFNSEMNNLRIVMKDHFTSVSASPENDALQAIISTTILRDYGEALTAGLRRHLHETAGFLMTSLEFEGFESSPNNEDAYCLLVSMEKGDLYLLDYYVIDEDISEAIEKDIVNDKSGIYKDCPKEISVWRSKSPEQRTAAERGMLVNTATGHAWDHNIDFKELKQKISDLKPASNLKGQHRKLEEKSLSI